MRKPKPRMTIRESRERVRAVAPKPAAVSGILPVCRRWRPPKAPRAPLSLPAAFGADGHDSDGLVKGLTGEDLTQKVKDLLCLAKEQGHLTYDDLNDALPDDLVTPADLDQILTKLRSLEVEIIDDAEVERSEERRVGKECR